MIGKRILANERLNKMKNAISEIDFRSLIRDTNWFSGSIYLIARIDIQNNCNEIELDSFTFRCAIADFVQLKNQYIEMATHLVLQSAKLQHKTTQIRLN